MQTVNTSTEVLGEACSALVACRLSLSDLLRWGDHLPAYKLKEFQRRIDECVKAEDDICFELFMGKVSALVASGEYSHTTSGHAACPDHINVYRRDPKSPTGCRLEASIKGSLRVREYLKLVSASVEPAMNRM